MDKGDFLQIKIQFLIYIPQLTESSFGQKLALVQVSGRIRILGHSSKLVECLSGNSLVAATSWRHLKTHAKKRGIPDEALALPTGQAELNSDDDGVGRGATIRLRYHTSVFT